MNVHEEHGGAGDRGTSGVRADYSIEAAQAAQDLVESISKHMAALSEEMFALSFLLRSYRRRDPANKGKIMPIRPE